jgi:hypothetical protein
MSVISQMVFEKAADMDACLRRHDVMKNDDGDG